MKFYIKQLPYFPKFKTRESKMTSSNKTPLSREFFFWAVKHKQRLASEILTFCLLLKYLISLDCNKHECN